MLRTTRAKSAKLQSGRRAEVSISTSLSAGSKSLGSSGELMDVDEGEAKQPRRKTTKQERTHIARIPTPLFSLKILQVEREKVCDRSMAKVYREAAPRRSNGLTKKTGLPRGTSFTPDAIGSGCSCEPEFLGGVQRSIDDLEILNEADATARSRDE